MSKIIKKVRECTVEDLITLGKQDNVRNLHIVIDGSNDDNKHFDVQICGTFYGRKLWLEDEVEIGVDIRFKTTSVEALYKASYTNVDIITKDGKVPAKDIIKQKMNKGGRKNDQINA